MDLGTAPSEFYHPASVAIDSNNNVYVVDGGNSRIQKFTGNGNFIAEWNGIGFGYYAIDSNNIIYLLGGSLIQKYDSNGKYLRSIPVGGSFFYIDKKSDELFITKSQENLVIRSDLSGNILAQWGGLGTGNGKFDGVRSVTLDNSGNVLVGDSQYSSQKSRVQKFDKNGNFIDSFQTGNGIYPECLAVDDNNRIIIGNIGGGYKIDVYDEKYILLQNINGAPDAAFNGSPPLFAVGNNGYLYVSDYGNNRVVVFK